MNIDSATANALAIFFAACIPLCYAAVRLNSAWSARYIGQEEELSAEEKTKALGDCISDLVEGVVFLFCVMLIIMLGAFAYYTGVVNDLIRLATGN
jgi:hypothetical protein